MPRISIGWLDKMIKRSSKCILAKSSTNQYIFESRDNLYPTFFLRTSKDEFDRLNCFQFPIVSYPSLVHRDFTVKIVWLIVTSLVHQKRWRQAFICEVDCPLQNCIKFRKSIVNTQTHYIRKLIGLKLGNAFEHGWILGSPIINIDNEVVKIERNQLCGRRE